LNCVDQEEDFKLKVIFFYRALGTGYSIERVFESIQKAMSNQIETRVVRVKFYGTNPFKVIWNAVTSAFFQGDINHITGDVHYLTLFMHKKRTILTIHDCGALISMRGWKRILLSFLWYFLAIRRSGIITVISESSKKELLNYVDCNRNQINVVYDCVSEDFRSVPKDFNSERPLILHVGTKKNKNLNRVAEALRGIVCHLRIIGNLSLDQKAILDENGIYYTVVSNISDDELVLEYQNCDMLSFVSTYEGFGLPIVEAQATGRPVVTSNISSMPEVSGEAACLVNPYDIDDIREGILQVIQNKDYRDKLIELGYRNVERFHPNRISKQYVALYKELLKK